MFISAQFLIDNIINSTKIQDNNNITWFLIIEQLIIVIKIISAHIKNYVIAMQ